MEDGEVAEYTDENLNDPNMLAFSESVRVWVDSLQARKPILMITQTWCVFFRADAA